jgi:hypothetical protein
MGWPVENFNDLTTQGWISALEYSGEVDSLEVPEDTEAATLDSIIGGWDNLERVQK